VRGLPDAATALSVGDDHACVLIRDGGVYCWGCQCRRSPGRRRHGEPRCGGPRQRTGAGRDWNAPAMPSADRPVRFHHSQILLGCEGRQNTWEEFPNQEGCFVDRRASGSSGRSLPVRRLRRGDEQTERGFSRRRPGKQREKTAPLSPENPSAMANQPKSELPHCEA